MPFYQLLERMMDGLDGALGAMFLDQEGEAVVIVPKKLPRYDLQVIGAYEGIYLSQLRRIAEDSGMGGTERFTISCANSTLLTFTLKDGYYLVLVLDHSGLEGVGWHRLARCRDAILEEM